MVSVGIFNLKEFDVDITVLDISIFIVGFCTIEALGAVIVDAFLNGIEGDWHDGK